MKDNKVSHLFSVLANFYNKMNRLSQMMPLGEEVPRLMSLMAKFLTQYLFEGFERFPINKQLLGGTGRRLSEIPSTYLNARLVYL